MVSSKRLTMFLAASVLLHALDVFAQQIGTCEYFTPNEGFSNAFCEVEDQEFYSFSAMSTSLRDPATGVGPELLSGMEAAGVDLDARCMISVGSKKLNENDRPGEPRATTVTVAGTQRRVIGNYGATASPDAGVLGVPVQCEVLEAILHAKSVTLTWSTKTSEQTFTVNEETVSGFRKALANVVADSQARTD